MITTEKLFPHEREWNVRRFRRDYGNVAYTEIELRLWWRVVFVSIQHKLGDSNVGQERAGDGRAAAGSAAGS